MPALSNVAITDTFDTWRIRTNEIIVKGNQDETITLAAYDKANSANVLAFQTGISANAYANLVWSRSNTYMTETIAGANTAVGAGANAYANLVWSRSNTYMTQTIAGANTAVGAGANSVAVAAFNKANTSLSNTSGSIFSGNLLISGNLGIGESLSLPDDGLRVTKPVSSQYARIAVWSANTRLGIGYSDFIALANNGTHYTQMGHTAGGGGYLYFNANTDSLVQTIGAKGLGIGTDTTTRLYISSTGNVGIGTTNPTEKLEIVGNTKLSNVIISGGINTTANNSYGSAGQVLTSNGRSVYWSEAAGGGIKSIQTFTSSGTWTKPSGVTKIIVYATGGGGGGGDGTDASGSELGGSGGGAGGTGISYIDVTSVSTVTVTVGSRGLKGANGSATTFGSYITANGGLQGYRTTVSGFSGRGGTTTGANVNITGGSATTTSNSLDGADGGASFWGGGGGGGGYYHTVSDRDGKAYGSGGGGGWWSTAGPGQAGGNGANGIVVVWEF